MGNLLGLPVPHVIGHMHCFWWWAVDYAPDGDISAYSDEDIALAAGWEGDPQQFVRAMINCGSGGKPGFVEVGEDGHREIHDWWEYAGKLISRRAANAERMKAHRAKHVQNTCSPRTGATNQPTNRQPTNQQTGKASSSQTPRHPGPPKFPEASEPYQIALFLRQRCHENDATGLPDATVPALQKWALEIDRLIRLDKRQPEEVRAVIEWCQQDSFWRANIRSAGALRDKFATLVLQRARAAPQPRQTFHDQNADFLARKQQEAQRDGKP